MTRRTNPIIRGRKGAFLPVILVISTLFMAFMTAMSAMAISNIKIANNHRDKIKALEIAEAGVNYYLWRLSHFNTDYCDGQTCIGNATDGYGPYSHDYTDANGKLVGSYELRIYPPVSTGSTVTIHSTGRVTGRLLTRKIICELGMPSFSRYTLFSQPIAPSDNSLNPEIWLGANEKINGSVFANMAGIFNQGEITKDATSTMSTFNSFAGGDGIDGVSGPGIFGGAKIYPATPVDIEKLNVDITNIRNSAKSGGGFYRDASGANGYEVILHENNFELYRVTQIYGTFELDSTSDANDLSIKQKTQTKKQGNQQVPDSLLGTFNYPESGIMAFEDNIWVSGKVDNQKITILAADPEESRAKYMKNIVIENNVLYTNYNGLDKIGLVTQRYILLPRQAPSTMEIDAAMIAISSSNSAIMIKSYCSPQWGDVSQYCASDHKTKIKIFGSMAHKGGLWWTTDWGSGRWSGYQSTETVMDEANVLNPPPRFPVTGSFQILSWREE